MKRLLIYVAGPLTAPTEGRMLDNVHLALRAARVILDMGHFPFVPHFTFFMDQVNWEVPLTYEQYMEWDRVLLERCDALFHRASSPGADDELAHAEKIGLLIYKNLKEIPRPEDLDRSLLEEEYETYLKEKPNLLRDHVGKVVLVKGSEVVDVFDSRKKALRAGYERFGNVPFLIQEIQSEEPLYGVRPSIYRIR